MMPKSYWPELPCIEQDPVTELGSKGRYVISPFEARLFSQIVDIERRCFRNPYSLEFLRLLTTWYPELFLIAASDCSVLGYVVASADGRWSHIISLAVKPECRRIGIATSLLKNLMERLRSIGVRQVLLEVREDNKAALRLYEKLGFRCSRRIGRYYEDGSGAIEFEKLL